MPETNPGGPSNGTTQYPGIHRARRAVGNHAVRCPAAERQFCAQRWLLQHGDGSGRIIQRRDARQAMRSLRPEPFLLVHVRVRQHGGGIPGAEPECNWLWQHRYGRRRALCGHDGRADNTAAGVLALFTDTTGAYNVATGANALASNTTGDGNVATGYFALFGNTKGGSNVAYGASHSQPARAGISTRPLASVPVRTLPPAATTPTSALAPMPSLARTTT